MTLRTLNGVFQAFCGGTVKEYSERPRRNNCKRKRGYFYVLEFGQPCRPLEAVLKVDGDERLRADARKVKFTVQVDGRTVLTHDVKSSSRLELTVGERKRKATDGPEPVTKHLAVTSHFGTTDCT